jgi:preprotein translocase subunit YajC
MIAHQYNRRRPRHIVNLNEELERRVQERKQMLRNLYQGSNIYCYESFRLSKTSFYELCAILREWREMQDTLNESVEEKLAIFLLIVAHAFSRVQERKQMLRNLYQGSNIYCYESF